MNQIKNEEQPVYGPVGQQPPTIAPSIQRSIDDSIIDHALSILESRIKITELDVTGCEDVKNYLKLKFDGLEHEVFGILYLNNRHQVIQYEELFRGTIDGASVYPREVIKRVLAVNANAVILTHNHPSGDPSPSIADKQITKRLKTALEYINVTLLDHIIVGGTNTASFAETGVL